jgi:hypothetical protein
MNSKGSDLIGAFFMSDGFVLRDYSCLSQNPLLGISKLILRM